MAEEYDATSDLAKAWDNAVEALADAKQRASSAETALLNAVNALGKRIDPGNQRENEVITLWVEIHRGDERLIESVKDDEYSYRVQERDPKHPLLPRPRPQLAEVG